MFRNQSAKEILEQLDRRWAKKLGCEPRDLQEESLMVVTDQAVQEGCLYGFDRGGSLVLRVNPLSYKLLVSKVPGLSDRTNPQFTSHNAVVTALQAAFTIRQGRPEAVFYRLNAHSQPGTQPDSTESVRRLTANDETDLKRLQQDCTEQELELGDVQIDHPIVYGYFVEGQLSSAASAIYQDSRIADIGVLTHPKYRKKGFGRVVVSALSQASIEEGLIPQYWTLKENIASLKLVTSLGFEQYGTETVLRFS